MKKTWAILASTIVLASLLGTTAMAAGSASASIAGTTSVQPGASYTYTISVKISGSMDFIGAIKFSGLFSHDPIYLDFHPSSNSGTTLTNKVTFKIPASAKAGDTGKITVTGQGDYLDAENNPIEYSVSKSLSAKVAAPAATKTPTATTKKPAATKTPTPATKKPAATRTPMATVRPTATSTPNLTATPSPTPTATPIVEGWDLAMQNAEALGTGGTLSMEEVLDTEVPVALLSALKEKGAKLTVGLGGYTCTIDGATLANIPSEDSVDLAMAMDKDPALSSAAAGSDLYQLHFAGSGQLPGSFAYSFKAGANAAGDTLYLYRYYAQAGVFEGVQSAAVDDAGNVAFDIYVCSDYIVTGSVLPGAAGSLATAVGERQEAQAQLADMHVQLEAAQGSAAQLEDQVKRQESQLEDAQSYAFAPQAETQGTLTTTPNKLLTGAGALTLLTVFFTMLFCRAGLFRRKR